VGYNDKDLMYYLNRQEAKMAEWSAQAKPAATRGDGAIGDGAFNGITPATKTIEAFAHAIAQMSRQALDHTTQHLEELRQVRSAEEVASIQSDFVKESLEHAVQHARTFIQMVVTLPPELVQPVNPAVDAAGAARHAAAARIERLSEVASKD
jgi:phasin family protein